MLVKYEETATLRDESTEQTSENGPNGSPQRSIEATTRRFHTVNSRARKDPSPIVTDIVTQNLSSPQKKVHQSGADTETEEEDSVKSMGQGPI